MLIDACRALAIEAHEGQTDLAGKPYVGHLARVVANVRPVVSYLMFTGDEEMTALLDHHDMEEIVELAEAGAWLHDIIEDTSISLDDLREQQLPDDLLISTDNMTKRKGERRDDYLERVKSHPISRIDKLADLMDNMDMTRLPTVTTKDLYRQQKYQRNLEFLIGRGRGNELHDQLMDWGRKVRELPDVGLGR